MAVTLLLTLCNIILLCLMILAATVFMPYRGLAKNFPETKGCAGWQQFGYNRKQHLKQSIIMLICCVVMAFVFVKI